MKIRLWLKHVVVKGGEDPINTVPAYHIISLASLIILYDTIRLCKSYSVISAGNTTRGDDWKQCRGILEGGLSSGTSFSRAWNIKFAAVGNWGIHLLLGS